MLLNILVKYIGFPEETSGSTDMRRAPTGAFEFGIDKALDDLSFSGVEVVSAAQQLRNFIGLPRLRLINTTLDLMVQLYIVIDLCGTLEEVILFNKVS
jgi:hypothetical protein